MQPSDEDSAACEKHDCEEPLYRPPPLTLRLNLFRTRNVDQARRSNLSRENVPARDVALLDGDGHRKHGAHEKDQ